ncbi:hypothetical protein BDA99DRAFT_562377 [Phascolomyces articulosus]|uniref:Uncharacterized protein n=1 Tax=Phascolomyces articulosus TaxID=60185 RepID=A0AAD5K434_9FUNG|nr:hypothetical protein BDA99DRAFT_562377 [Phascolomyces articulosus]
MSSPMNNSYYDDNYVDAIDERLLFNEDDDIIFHPSSPAATVLSDNGSYMNSRQPNKTKKLPWQLKHSYSSPSIYHHSSLTASLTNNNDITNGNNSNNKVFSSSTSSSIPIILITDYDNDKNSMNEVIASQEFLLHQQQVYHEKGKPSSYTPPISISSYQASLSEQYRTTLSRLL